MHTESLDPSLITEGIGAVGGHAMLLPTLLRRECPADLLYRHRFRSREQRCERCSIVQQRCDTFGVEHTPTCPIIVLGVLRNACFEPVGYKAASKIAQLWRKEVLRRLDVQPECLAD